MMLDFRSMGPMYMAYIFFNLSYNAILGTLLEGANIYDEN